MCVQNLKFIALAVPEIIGVLKKWAVPAYMLSDIRGRDSPKFKLAFVQMDTVNVGYQLNLKFVALPVPEIIVIAVLRWSCEPPILGKRRS